MRILVTGADGQLGSDVVKEMNSNGHDVISTDVKGNVDYFFDITNENHIQKIKELQPDAIIHCAAWTDVDTAEIDANKENVFKINVTGTKNLVSVAKELSCLFIYISTALVFDGKGEFPICVNDFAYPINFYGHTKLEAEKEVLNLQKYFILRTSWLFGDRGNNFVKEAIETSKYYKEVKVPNDYIGTPTFTEDFAKELNEFIKSTKYGIYNVTNEYNYISLYELYKEVYKALNINIDVEPISLDEYEIYKAQRPKNIRLEKMKLSVNGFKRLPNWKDSLNKYLEKYIKKETF